MRFIHHVLAPLEGQLASQDYGRLVASLATAFGPEAAISLTDVAQLDADDALQVMGMTSGWILDGALAAAGLAPRRRP